MNKLAVIIPAYKSQYFASALNSLATQTNKNFSVYVGDDCSPNDLKSICDQFSTDLSINYTRFEKNIGAKNLVEQWGRCVALSGGEEWIWLFSDDDIAQENCIEKFYETSSKFEGKFDVFRFNTSVINEHGDITSKSPFGPQIESSEEMAYNLLLGRRGNSMPDHIFSRKIYNETGGFVNTLFAQGADWATSIKFSQQKGMCIILDAILFWRYSGHNISSLASKGREEMSTGYFQFVDWVSHHFLYLKYSPSNIKYADIMSANLLRLREVLTHHYGGISRKMIVPLYKLLRSNFKMNIILIINFIVMIRRKTKTVSTK